MAFTNVAHHIDLEWMREAFRRTRKDGAVGVDGQSAAQFAEGLEGNLQELLQGMRSGTYHAPPVRRVHIPKADGRQRPLGIPTFGDKVLQRAVAMALEAVYEQDFLDCSYGFRPRRSAHQALETLWRSLGVRGGWVLEVDIKGFFDNLDHSHLRAILAKRVRDKSLRKLIDKWLRAGVLEDGKVRYSALGTPQGGVISPILANIYLHEVVDIWFEEVVKPRMVGKAQMTRFADDLVMVFYNEADARRVWGVLAKRFARYGLELHPEKTKLIEFRPPVEEKAPTFDFLGFTVAANVIWPPWNNIIWPRSTDKKAGLGSPAFYLERDLVGVADEIIECAQLEMLLDLSYSLFEALHCAQ
jgi:group II intron reverse transcriptase/maturase